MHRKLICEAEDPDTSTNNHFRVTQALLRNTRVSPPGQSDLNVTYISMDSCYNFYRELGSHTIENPNVQHIPKPNFSNMARYE